MVKNIILDIGGVLFDDSKRNIEKILNKNCDAICKEAYGAGFKQCLLGNKTVREHVGSLIDSPNFEDIEYILNPNNLSISYPIIRNNFEYVKTLRDGGYKLYLLTNITEDSYNYIDNLINFKTTFDGRIYSFQEHVIKPNPEIYNLLIDRFQLKKEETIFFDDREKNVIAGLNVGIKSIVFKTIQDIENNL